MTGAEFLVKALEAHGVTHVFGIPGAKVDSVFTALLDSPIELVLCRHEQNAAFMAQAFGRLTGRIGVCLATSGLGVTNLVTGLATATTEGDPVLAIGGEVPLDDRFKQTHQSLDAISLMQPVTRFGLFNAVTGGKYLQYIPETGRLLEFARQPEARFAEHVLIAALPGVISPTYDLVHIVASPDAFTDAERKAFLDLCDRVKFAAEHVGSDDCREAIDQAYRIVDATKPRIEAPPAADSVEGAA